MHPLWRFLLAVIVIFGTMTLTGAITGTAFMMVGIHPSLEVAVFTEAALFTAVICAIFKLMLSAFDHRPFGSMGLAFHPRWWKELRYGISLGAAMIFAVALVEWIAHDASFGFRPHTFLLGGIFAMCMFAAAAAKEEIIFRGYAFQQLAEAITPTGAVVLMSLLFGLVHLANPHRTWVSTLNTALVGLPLSIAYLRTKALWMPIGIHFIWNFLQGFFLGLPVSGMMMTGGVLSAHVTGPEFLTGGAYGPEGGVIATIVILIATVYVGLAKHIRPAREMEELAVASIGLPGPREKLSLFRAAHNSQNVDETR
jgi:membrane protease YdiL (CAAX protease family)